MAKHILLLLAAALFLLGGCVIHKEYKDNTLDDQYSDAGLKTAVSSALLQEDATLADNVEVYCFKGHVFLIGEAPEDYRRFAIAAAESVKGVTSVTPHWFPDGTGRKMRDAAMAAEVESKLMFDESLTSSRMAVVVWDRNVLLLGVMNDKKSIDKAVDIARGERGVKSVTSYLLQK